jgi:hypothetical protein
MAEELKVVDQTYELVLWIHRHVERFPRHSKFSVGSRLEDKGMRLLELLIEAKFSSEKTESLRNAGLVAEQLRFVLRIAKDTHLIAIKSHGFATGQLVEICKQIQAWRKHQVARTEPKT